MHTIMNYESLSPSVHKVDDSILKTAFDQKFLKFYESKYNVSSYTLSPFYDKENIKNREDNTLITIKDDENAIRKKNYSTLYKFQNKRSLTKNYLKPTQTNIISRLSHFPI